MQPYHHKPKEDSVSFRARLLQYSQRRGHVLVTFATNLQKIATKERHLEWRRIAEVLQDMTTVGLLTPSAVIQTLMEWKRKFVGTVTANTSCHGSNRDQEGYTVVSGEPADSHRTNKYMLWKRGGDFGDKIGHIYNNRWTLNQQCQLQGHHNVLCLQLPHLLWIIKTRRSILM
jgi:hypothetical protein